MQRCKPIAALEAGAGGVQKCALPVLLAPVLRAVPDMQDFSNIARKKPVHDDVARCYQFARAFHFSRSAKIRERRQLRDAVKNCLRGSACGLGVVFTDAVNLRFQFVGGVGRPPYRGHDWKSRSMRATTSS